MLRWIVLLALLAPAASRCVFPTLPAHARSIEQFIPPGWRIEHQARGLLDEGKRPAVAFIVHAAPAKTSARPETYPRILAVACRRPDGSYELGLQNHTLPPCLPAKTVTERYQYNLGGALNEPPLSIVRGTLRVRLSATYFSGRTSDAHEIFTFRFKSPRLVLIGYDTWKIGYHLASANVSDNYLTGKASRSIGESCAGREEILAKCWETDQLPFNPGGLPSIDQIGDGLFFDPSSR